jgi:hypothetical protein
MLLSSAALLFALVAAPSPVAVVDVGDTPEPALAAALRELPALRKRALSASATRAIVQDAKDLGVSCAVDDAVCLHKLMVLLRVSELVAVAQSRTHVTVVWLGPHGERRGVVPARGPVAMRARIAWLKAQPPGKDDDVDPVGDEDIDDVDDVDPVDGTRAPPSPPPSTPPAAVPDDVVMPATTGPSPGVVVGLAGLGGTVLCGAGALFTSGALAGQLDDAATRGVPLNDGYYTLDAVFVGLSVCTVAAVVTGAVGVVLQVVAPAPSETTTDVQRTVATSR